MTYDVSCTSSTGSVSSNTWGNALRGDCRVPLANFKLDLILGRDGSTTSEESK
jgi:hypothetical protein